MGAWLESCGLGLGFVGDRVHLFSDGLCSSQICGCLHSDEGADALLKAPHVVVHPCGLVHVREFQHDGLELMVVGIDQSFLGEVLETVVGTDRGVDRDELEVEYH